jgi:hypothetical protein
MLRAAFCRLRFATVIFCELLFSAAQPGAFVPSWTNLWTNLKMDIFVGVSQLSQPLLKEVVVVVVV